MSQSPGLTYAGEYSVIENLSYREPECYQRVALVGEFNSSTGIPYREYFGV
jgi:hypothetical protein